MTDDYYSVNLPLFKLDENKKILIPKETDSIWFDVGLSFSAPNSVQFLNRNPAGFVIGFEPDPRMYFSLFSAPYFAQNMWLLDNSHSSAKEELEYRKSKSSLSDTFKHSTEEYLEISDALKRYIIVPAAISDYRGTARLNFDPHHGSSTLARPSSDNHLISTFRLDEFIDMVPSRFEYIDHLKIDAEGLDHKVVLSAGFLINKFVVISTEMRMDALMHRIGFKFIKIQPGSFSYVNVNKEDLLPKIDYEIRV